MNTTIFVHPWKGNMVTIYRCKLTQKNLASVMKELNNCINLGAAVMIYKVSEASSRTEEKETT